MRRFIRFYTFLTGNRMPPAPGSDTVKNGRWFDCIATIRNADFLNVAAKTTITYNQAYCYFSKLDGAYGPIFMREQ